MKTMSDHKKRRRGQPRKMNDTIRSVLVAMFHEDATQEEACAEAGISVSTLKREMDRDEGFLNEITKAQTFPLRVARQSVVRHMANDGNLALKFLERRDSRYKPRTQYDTTDEDRAEQLRRIEEAGLSLPTYPDVGFGYEPVIITKRRMAEMSVSADR